MGLCRINADPFKWHAADLPTFDEFLAAYACSEKRHTTILQNLNCRNYKTMTDFRGARKMPLPLFLSKLIPSACFIKIPFRYKILSFSKCIYIAMILEQSRPILTFWKSYCLSGCRMLRTYERETRSSKKLWNSEVWIPNELNCKSRGITE